eukprot:1842773-Lingulodinium_polyedra.AAC.1
MATGVDFALGTAKTEVDLHHLLATDDRLEVSLRHLAAFVYESRTKDRDGAAHIRALTIPGGNADIAPAWL